MYDTNMAVAASMNLLNGTDAGGHQLHHPHHHLHHHLHNNPNIMVEAYGENVVPANTYHHGKYQTAAPATAATRMGVHYEIEPFGNTAPSNQMLVLNNHNHNPPAHGFNLDKTPSYQEPPVGGAYMNESNGRHASKGQIESDHDDDDDSDDDEDDDLDEADLNSSNPNGKIYPWMKKAHGMIMLD